MDALEFIDLVDRRVGTTPRERLAWVVAAVQRQPKDMTPGDRQNLRVEMAGFYHFETHAQGTPYIPTEEEAQEALRAFGQAIQRAVRRERISAGEIITEATGRRVRAGELVSDLAAVWDSGAGRFVAWDCTTAEWPTRATFALVRLIVESGHLLKECPAPASRGKEGEMCGVWFVANRPTQEYCSGTCQSRASTRAAREGAETPATLRRREAQTQKEG
ncbi:MAG: hypothetical protein HY712_04350 [candidate division NC10 bacterium]|nr:hypothetical protein [candidate division NC10 bacterium]